MNLTKQEIQYLIELIEDNESGGDYYGNKEQYWARVASVKEKLNKLYEKRAE